MKLRFSPSCYFLLLIFIQIFCRNGNTSSGYISISPRVQSFATKNISIEKKEEDQVIFRSKMSDSEPGYRYLFSRGSILRGINKSITLESMNYFDRSVN
jgi:hypothetical protein